MSGPSLYILTAALSATAAALLAMLFTPWVRALALKKGAAHAPRGRDIHLEPIPRWGGLAVFVAFVLSLVVGALILHYVFHRPVGERTLRLGIGLVLAGTILSVVGALDDRYDLSAAKQMAAQFVCALVVLPFGVVIEFVTNPFTKEMIPLGWIGYPLTVVWLVAVANAVNWIDGIDGLAAGVSAIAASTMALLAAMSNQPALAVLAAGLGGALLGFLRYNFNPAKIFLGGGAQVTGFILACISTVGAFKAPIALAFLVPLLILALPIFDTTVVILRRWRAGKPIHQADKSHLHHRLLELGYTQKQTVLILYGISITLCGLALMGAMALGLRF
jgi:UDP-GlcNAc:undecaprenyl-phosphate GlcNAc-1-phosphate transferase